MTVIRRTNPLGELLSLRQAMDRLFDDSFVRRPSLTSDEHQLALDVRTTADSLVVEAALPGIKPEDVDVSVLGDALTISASHRSDESHDEEGYSYREIRRGSFSRSVTLPSNVKTDAATATFENGMLTLTFPKAEEARPRQIPISGSTSAAHAELSANGASASTGDSAPATESPSAGEYASTGESES